MLALHNDNSTRRVYPAAAMIGETTVKGRKKMKAAYVYIAKVVGVRRGFTLEAERPLESGHIVEKEGVSYRVTYVYKQSAPKGGSPEAIVILRPKAAKRGPGRPRKKL